MTKFIRIYKKNEADYEEIIQTEEAVAVTITWGDWKHSHKRVDYLMGQIGFKLLGEKVTEEDGSDCYSSIHVYNRK